MNITEFSQSLHAKLLSVKNISLIAHKAPDGDAYGSLEGMRALLENNYSHLAVTVVLPKESTIDPYWDWILSVKPALLVPETTELVLFLDASPLSRTALAPGDYPHCEIIPIDHHEVFDNSIEGFRDIEAPSTTTVISDIARVLSWKISSQAATALLLGLYADTGGFLHRNSTQRAFETAAFLLSCGARQGDIVEKAFGNYPLSYLHELGQGLLAIVVQDSVACLFLPNGEDNPHLKNDIITYLSGIADVDIACVLTTRAGEVKGSLRTRKDNIDVNELAKKLNGGGHKKASGFSLQKAQLNDNVLVWNERTYTTEGFIQHLGELFENTKYKIQSTK